MYFFQEEGYEEIRGEIEMLQQCSHPNVVRYLGSYQGEEYLWVRMQKDLYSLVLSDNSSGPGNLNLYSLFISDVWVSNSLMCCQIVMEYCGGGSVSDLMNAAEEPLEEYQIAFICREALKVTYQGIKLSV